MTMRGIACESFMSRVFSNILGNTYKYAKLKIRVTLKKKNDGCHITIEDDGEGISSQDQEKLFMPVYRASTSQNKQLGGHGMGMAIAWNIVKHHQGEIQVDKSTLGGLRVSIFLRANRLSTT
jgi:signal transduction histidine kinase